MRAEARRALGILALAAGLLGPPAPPLGAQPGVAAPPGPAALPGAPAAPAALPKYLPYVEFTADETAASLPLKQAYNEAVRRYNEALYEYHVVLARHDQLVERHNLNPDPVERGRAREAATALRAKLGALRQDVTQRAASVDQAARRAAAGGVAVTR